MVKHRKHYTPEEKVSILRRHLVEKVPVSDLCQEQKLQATVFYRWLKEFFENGATAFQRDSDRESRRDKERIAALELRDIAISTPDVEDLFLRYYHDAPPASDAVQAVEAGR